MTAQLYAWECEALALSFGMQSDEQAMKFCSMLKPAMFWFPDHRVIAGALHEMHQQRMPIDQITLRRYMSGRGLLASEPTEFAVSAETYLETAAMCLTPSQFEPNAATVRDLWTRRIIRERALEVAEEVLNPARSMAWQLDQAATLTTGLVCAEAGAVTAATVDLKPHQQGVKLLLGDRLDMATGGAQPGQITVIQAATKVGKTTAMVQSMTQALLLGQTCIYVPIADLSPSDLSRKVIRQMCGWDRPPEQPSLQDAYYSTVDEFRSFGDRLTIFDPNASSGTTDIEAVTSWLDAQCHRLRPDRIYLDYFQRFTTREKAEVGPSMYAVIAQKLGKWSHRQQESIIYVGSQETADGSTRWSLELENETALCIRFTKPEGDEKRRVATVGLNRFGPMGETVGFSFDSHYLSFREDRE
jgi:KaiC/GvpD/RAD55 family RecA-like ATPase